MREITQNLSDNKKRVKVAQPYSSGCRKARICHLEDEDIVNRQESFITEDFLKSSDPSRNKYWDKDDERDLYVTESPEILRHKLPNNYFTNTNDRYATLTVQPCGDQEEEIVLEADDNEDFQLMASCNEGKILNGFSLTIYSEAN